MSVPCQHDYLKVKHRITNLLIVLAATLALMHCAQRGTPTGGPVDEQPPTLLRAFPDNYTTGFTNQKIELEFDEYITFKDLQKQLVISPPLEYRPIITPQGGTARKITIQIQDTLQEDTTYVLNFGQSIVDHNEANPYPFFKYVFSTGTYIDSLKLKGRVTSAFEPIPDDFVSVLLYEMDQDYTDSLIYNGRPDYVLNTLDSLTTFTLENLRPGTYRMVALKEVNSDLKFDPARDRMGFIQDSITVPGDREYELRLFKPIDNPSIKRPFQVSRQRIDFGYTGSRDSLSIRLLNPELIEQERFTKLEKKDTLNYWFRPVDQALDSLSFIVSTSQQLDTFKVKFKDVPKDSLVIKQEGKLSLKDPLRLKASTPLQNLNNELINLRNRDSVLVNYTSKINEVSNVATLNFDREEKQKYTLQLLPGAVSDFLGAKNIDTLNFNYTTGEVTKFANIFVDLVGGSQYPVIVQAITSPDLNIVAQQSVDKAQRVAFEFLDPGTYQIRIIYDANGNGTYDTGNFLMGIQPEKVSYSTLINIQANWDHIESINLE